jgi:hypothetical protein
MNYKPLTPKIDYEDGQSRKENPQAQEEDPLWQRWQESIHPMTKAIEKSERVTEQDLSVMVY